VRIKKIRTVFKREMGAYFDSAIATIYLIVFIAINSGLFMSRYFLIGKADMRAFFEIFPYVLLVFIPVLTMRLWSEDRKEHTFELLMTFPMRPAEIVVGKYLASLSFYLIALASTCTIPVMVFFTGAPDKGMMSTGYLGAALIGALFLSVGIFISGLTKEQVVAFVLTVLSCCFLYFLGIDFFASLLDGWVEGLGTFLMVTIGAASHLNGFWKGVIDLKDILYFVVFIGTFLFLNSLFLEERNRPKGRLIFSSAVVAGILIVVLFGWFVRDMALGRFDITEDRIHTMSPASRRILGNLKAPLWINLYMTPAEKMPTPLKTLEQDVVGKLEELRIASHNKLGYKVTYVDAAKFMEKKEGDAGDSLERALRAKEIMPYQFESIERDQVGMKLVCAALTIDYKEKGQEVFSRIVPQVLPDLEYLILSRVVKLTRERRPRIALFAPLQEMSIAPQLLQLVGGPQKEIFRYTDQYNRIEPLLVGNGYRVSRIGLTRDSGIPPGVDALLVLGPGSLNDRQRYEINAYLRRGGKAFIAAQGYMYVFQTVAQQVVHVVSRSLILDINKLTKPWGVAVNHGRLMDESHDQINVPSGQGMGETELSVPLRMPNQILVRPETMNRELALMRHQPAFFYMWGSALDVSEEDIKKAGLTSTVLFTSSPASWIMPGGVASWVPMVPQNVVFPEGLSRGPERRMPLGVILEGRFPDNFVGNIPGWPVAEEETVTAEEGGEEPEAEPGRLVLIGCSHMFTDGLIGNKPNLGLFTNIVDSLVLDDDVVRIRGKALVNRDVRRLTDAQRLGWRFFTTGLVPVLLAGYSFMRLFLRRKEKRLYLTALGRGA